MLPILMLHGNSLSRAQSFSITRQLLIDIDGFDSREGSHIRRSTALFRFLIRAAQEAEFVRIFAGIFADAGIFEGAEDSIRAKVFGEVVGMFRVGFSGIRECFLCRFETFASCSDFFGFGAGVIVGEDAVVDEGLAEIAEVFVYECAEGRWEVGGEGEYCENVLEI